MPIGEAPYYVDETERVKAWTDHYIRKGAHPIKARWVAWRKVRNKKTWPPK